MIPFGSKPAERILLLPPKEGRDEGRLRLASLHGSWPVSSSFLTRWLSMNPRSVPQTANLPYRRLAVGKAPHRFDLRKRAACDTPHRAASDTVPSRTAPNVILIAPSPDTTFQPTISYSPTAS